MIAQSNGGVMGVDTACQLPVRTTLSGPAAGVIAAGYIAETAGFPDVITGDVGGTSFDVSLVAGGQSSLAPQTSIDLGMVVRTPMIEATTIYNSMPVLSPDEAVDMIVDAVIKKPKRIATQMGIALQVLNTVAPKFAEVVMNTVFRMFSDSAAAKGDKKPEEVQVSNEQVALGALMKGVHF